MGDVLHAMPAVAALRLALPTASIGWVIEERWAELLCGTTDAVLALASDGRPLVDAVHLVNTMAWRSAPFSDETWSEIASVRRAVRSARYDIALDFQGAIKSALIAQLSGAPSRVGFAHPRENLAGLFYTRQVGTVSAHVIDQNLELASEISGTPLHDAPYDLALDPAAETWCRAELHRLRVERYAILNPGAGWGAKCWPVESYAAVARDLTRIGLRSLINYSPAESELASDLEHQSDGAAVKVLCSISELVALTRRASLLIGGDTGPLHLADALKVPIVALFGPTDPARNGPYGTRSVILRSANSKISYKHHGALDTGLASITPAEVFTAAKDLLGIG